MVAIALARLARGKARRVLLLGALAAAPLAAAEPTLPSPSASEADDSETLVDIPDAVLRKAVEAALDKAAGDPITRGEMANLRTLRAEGVRQLTGIEYAINLRTLRLPNGAISDVSRLADLTSLRYLTLDDNAITDVAPLAGLTSLTSLWLYGNAIRDLGPLADMTALTHLYLGGNEISELGPLTGLTSLTSLGLYDNAIRELGPLADMTALTSLHLRGNEISELGPLAGMTSLTYLNLSGNEISDLGPLADMTALTSLGLYDNAIRELGPLADMTALTELDLYGNEISELGPLAGMTALTRLYLHNNEISDVSPLAGMTALTQLWLYNNEISDVGPLAGMTALTFLSLSGNAITDVSPLAGMTALTFLSLSGNAITDVSPLAGMTALTSLHMYRNEIRELGALAGLTSLTRLNLGGNEISELGPLAGMTSLTGLWLSFNEISDLSPLADMTALTILSLDDNAITDVAPLAGMTALTSLSLSLNEIRELGPLADLTSLRDLSLYGNEIRELGPLAGMTSLTSLSLGLNEIRELGPLADMTALTTLWLYNNAITDVGPLAGMTALTELSLGNNRIFDVSPLAGMTALTELSLGSNAIADVGPLAGMTALTRLYLSGNQIRELEPLAGLTSLTWLYLSANDISDVAPLVANDGLGRGDHVDLRWNTLGPSSRETHIPTLVQRGVEVLFTAFDPPEMPDVGLRQAIVRAMVAGLEFAGGALDASNRGIEDLTGIEKAAGLRLLFLDRNRITDIAPLAGLNRLTTAWDYYDGLITLTLAHNPVEDLTPLAAMRSLRYLALDSLSLRDLPQLPRALRSLYLSDNSISDIASLANLNILDELDVSGNSITSLAPLGRHWAGQSPPTWYDGLRYLHVSDNQVADISPLNFEPLRELHLRNNAVRDISPLLNAEELLMVDARRNPLADDALAVLDTLRERRVTVLAGETAPYFPAAGGSRQGFARIVNRSDEDGHVFIDAVDDAGVRARRVRLDVGGRRAVHFNSEDLEFGNAAKGLSGGVGAPTAGDWRLSVVSALDVEVLSYIRTEDGFVTAMHDVAADAMVPFFNPGSNENQRSILRVVNTEAEPAKWTTGGYDDRGVWHPMAGALLVRPQHALTLTAQALENTHGLGGGHGKWRLRTRGFPWFAMSLLESPTGHLVNLSTAPDNATPLADGGAMHRLPLFPAAGGARQGFARVINRSYSGGEVAIVAVDDEGVRSGPVRLTMRPRRAAHFNSADLEGGNAAKGLDGGVGVGAGDWRLEVASELELMVLSYARTADGFLTSLHDLAPVAEDGGHRVVFFNPGSNTGQVSKLRLINDGERAAAATVTGIDDHGNRSGTVTLTVPAGSARVFTSAELEAGGAGLAGRLGDGSGKWRLRVRSDAPIAVMSLLETPSGHLTNVSTGTAD